MDNVEGEADNSGSSTDNVFGSNTRFVDAELAALRSERDRLKSALSTRTEAWSSALWELSETQAELAQLRAEVAETSPDGLSNEDWQNITGEVDQDHNQGRQV